MLTELLTSIVAHEAATMPLELTWFIVGMAFGLGFLLSFAAGYVFARKLER